MKTFTKITLFFSLFIYLISGCQKFEEYPVEPHIAFDHFTLLVDTVIENDTAKAITNRGILAISYTDGDGDLGLNNYDTLPPFNQGSPFYYNIIVKYFEKQNGVFVQVPILNPDGSLDTIHFNGRFPYLTPSGVHKAIRGIIYDTLPVNNQSSTFDTIKFKVFIYDRALHQSNLIETPEIVVLK